MSAAPAAYALSARLARREVFRRPWRTLLVALLIAIPVAGMTVAAVFARSDRLSAADSWQLTNGQADAILQSDGGNTSTVTIPPGSKTVVGRAAYFRLIRTTDSGRTRASMSDLAANDPIVSGIITLDDGRLPTADGEVLLSPSAARDLGAHTGDTIELTRPTTRTVVVTGIGHFAADRSESLVLTAPGSDFLGVSPDVIASTTYLQLPASMSQAERDAWARASRSPGFAQSPVAFPDLVEVSAGSADAAVRWTWVLGGLVLTVAGIVITSAFASGARRQLATLGQLAANGAGPQVLRRTLLLRGTWTGIVGSIAGLGLGFATLQILDRYRDRLFDRDSSAYVYRLIDLVPIVVMGIVATTIAALIPARSTSRIPVLAALAGRRPLGRVPRRLTVSGVVAVAGGLGLLALAVIGSTGDDQATLWTAMAAMGSIAVLLGASAIAPALVGLLEPLASRLHGPWRFAARSLVRQRTRTGGVVAAVCATSALAIMASALVLGIIAGDETQFGGNRDDEVQLVSHEVAAPPSFAPISEGPSRVPVGSVVAVPEDLLTAMQSAVSSLRAIHTTVLAVEPTVNKKGISSGPMISRFPAVADASTLDAYDFDDAAARALRQYGAIYLDDGIGDAVPTTVELGGRTIDLHKVSAGEVGLLPRILITPALAEELHLATVTGPTVLRAPHDLTSSELDLLSEVRDDYMTTANADGKYIMTGAAIFSSGDAPPAFVLEALLSGIALAFALFVVAASLALAAAETRDERDALAVIGAAPSTMRRTSAHKAVLLAVLGAALAIPVGFLPVVVFTAADDSATPFLVFPWRTVAMLLLVVPAVIGLFTGGASSVALRLRPVRVSTMTFD
ncbi:MAG TPA: FtsX-like permease family protein [Acidimicrobiales bacterium]|nr:FtsX-like permease family protein [Acidimicrobiales bacterium]